MFCSCSRPVSLINSFHSLSSDRGGKLLRYNYFLFISFFKPTKTLSLNTWSIHGDRVDDFCFFRVFVHYTHFLTNAKHRSDSPPDYCYPLDSCPSSSPPPRPDHRDHSRPMCSYCWCAVSPRTAGYCGWMSRVVESPMFADSLALRWWWDLSCSRPSYRSPAGRKMKRFSWEIDDSRYKLLTLCFLIICLPDRASFHAPRCRSLRAPHRSPPASPSIQQGRRARDAIWRCPAAFRCHSAWLSPMCRLGCRNLRAYHCHASIDALDDTFPAQCQHRWFVRPVECNENVLGMFSLLFHFRVLSFSSSFVRPDMMIHRVLCLKLLEFIISIKAYSLHLIFTSSYHRVAQLGRDSIDVAHLTKIVRIWDGEHFRFDGRLTQQTGNEIVLRSHCAIAEMLVEAVALLRDDYSKEWTGGGERSMKVIVIVDGQQIIIARINVRD